MKIKLNGEIKELPDGATIEALLESLSIKAQGIAVEVNREIVPKRLFGASTLNEGDAVEIVRMVGGG
ncbi:MAG: thiamine biosynthesis protein ThiS [Deltaproteobacteria bacterium GWA2_54_12]|nr:MAG: thiamine biosynthesis protein ThiS [Deltaproteobacteria bacterium GWA2_54_12]